MLTDTNTANDDEDGVDGDGSFDAGGDDRALMQAEGAAMKRCKQQQASKKPINDKR